MNRAITINKRRIGLHEPIYIVAEMSANHNGDCSRAVRIIEAAAEAGADAVKLQTYTADTMTIDASGEPFRIEGTLWEGRTLYDLYEEAHTPREWHADLQTLARENGLDFFSTAFDASAVGFLEELDVPAYKISSFESVDLPLIRRIAQTGKPAIMSTGMATLREIDEAVRAFRDAGGEELALLKCTSAYPAPPEEANLRTIPHLADAFNVPAGLSDHTIGEAVPVAAAALGACVIEKHLTLSREDEGPDSDFSMEPGEFARMVDAVRTAEKALGRVRYDRTPAQEESTVFRRSLFVVKDVGKDEPLTEQNVRSIRPGHGLHTRHLSDVLGRSAARRLERGTPLQWELVK